MTGAGAVCVRRARPADVPALAELRLANAERHAALDPAGHRVPEPEPVRRYFTELLRAGASSAVVVLVAEVSGTVAGLTELVLQLQPPPDHQIHVPRPQAQVHTVVLEQFQGRGIGTALVRAAEREAAQRGVAVLIAPILARNTEAVGFYSGAGFGPHGIILKKELTASSRGEQPVDDRLGPAFAAFCAGHRGELGPLLHSRSNQTNEIRRCLALRLGLDYVRSRWPGPVALVEAGASAGLNLLVDRYGYRVGGRAEASASDAPLTITGEVRGELPDVPVLGPVPEVSCRLGLDQQPASVTDPGARAWLEAFVWPEQTDDLAAPRAAIGVAAEAGVTVMPGDAVTDTARLVGELPGRSRRGVHRVAAQLPRPGRREGVLRAAHAGRRGPPRRVGGCPDWL